MIITNIATKTRPEVTSIPITVDYINTKNIYQLKTEISNLLKIDLDTIFLYNSSIANDTRRIYQNMDLIENIDEIFYKILKNSCNECGAKATMITGDCNFCKCKYCNLHRLPESHKCACIHTLKKDSYNENFTRVMNGKCVAAQI
jgi:predicted nucleic acid binding AN1-type Zn finger protein